MPVLQFSDILKIFTVESVNAVSMIEKGENALKSDHLLKFEVTKEGQINAIVRRSYVKDPAKAYRLQITLPCAGHPELSMTCQCPNGKYRCHHMAAVALHIKDNLSQTDTECSWSNPHKKPRLVESCVADLHAQYVSKQNPENLALNSADKEILSQLDPTQAFSLQWLSAMDYTTRKIDTTNSAISILKSTLKTGFDVNQLKQALEKTNDEIFKISRETAKQRTNPKWILHRKFVLTSSNFGKILHQIEINRYPPSLFKTLHGEYKKGAKSCKFGIDNEEVAISKYREITGNIVEETGLHLLPCGFLGGSPDGLVNHDAILEVKCSYQQYLTNKSFFELSADPDIIFCLEIHGDLLHLNRSHNYFSQIQGNLLATNREHCDFFLWSPSEYFLERIYKDKDWISNVATLEKFYFTHFLNNNLSKSILEKHTI